MFIHNKLMVLFYALGLIVLEGKILVKGNEPFTQLFLVTNQQSHYLITGSLKNKLWEDFQGKTVRLKGDMKELNIRPGPVGEFNVHQILKENDPDSGCFTE